MGENEEPPPLPKRSEAILVDLEGQIENMKQRIKLSEAEWKAEKEEREEKVKQNKDRIAELRAEVHDLQFQISKAKLGDERVIKKAFRKHTKEIGVMRGRSGKNAVEVLEGKVFDLCKKRDALYHEISLKEKILEDTKQQYDAMVATCNLAITSDPSESESGKRLRELENEYEKVQMKISEAEHVQRKYKSIQDLLVEELINLPRQLDELEEQFNRQQNEIEKLIEAQEKAQAARETTKQILSKVEAEAIQSRQERDKVVMEFNQVMEQRQNVQTDSEGSSKKTTSAIPDTPSMAEKIKKLQKEQEKELTNFNEAFDQIKEAVGVTDIQEAESRFISQNTIRENLAELKQRGEKRLHELREEKWTLEGKLESLKGTGQARSQSDIQSDIDKTKRMLEEQEKRRNTAQAEVDQITQLLAEIKSGLWHQLQLIERHLAEDDDETACPPSDIPLLELAELCENRIEELMGHFEGQDLSELRQQMKQEGFLRRAEEEKPAEAAPAPKPKAAAGEETEESEDEEGQNRNALKKTAEVFAEVKKKQKGRGRQLLKI